MMVQNIQCRIQCLSTCIWSYQRSNFPHNATLLCWNRSAAKTNLYLFLYFPTCISWIWISIYTFFTHPQWLSDPSSNLKCVIFFCVLQNACCVAFTLVSGCLLKTVTIDLSNEVLWHFSPRLDAPDSRPTLLLTQFWSVGAIMGMAVWVSVTGLVSGTSWNPLSLTVVGTGGHGRDKWGPSL